MKKTIFLLSIVLIFVSCNDNHYKNILIENKDSITYNTEPYFGDKYYHLILNDSYYQDVTIKMLSDSSYTVVFWGDRESWLWNFKLDKDFIVDIPYNRYKGKNVDRDLIILNILNDVKNK